MTPAEKVGLIFILLGLYSLTNLEVFGLFLCIVGITLFFFGGDD